MTVSASYLNTAHATKFGFKHYGYDCYGSITVYAQGYGVVLAKGTDSCYGNFVVVMYGFEKNVRLHYVNRYSRAFVFKKGSEADCCLILNTKKAYHLVGFKFVMKNSQDSNAGE